VGNCERFGFTCPPVQTPCQARFSAAELPDWAQSTASAADFRERSAASASGGDETVPLWGPANFRPSLRGEEHFGPSNRAAGREDARPGPHPGRGEEPGKQGCLFFLPDVYTALSEDISIVPPLYPNLRSPLREDGSRREPPPQSSRHWPPSPRPNVPAIHPLEIALSEGTSDGGWVSAPQDAFQGQRQRDVDLSLRIAALLQHLPGPRVRGRCSVVVVIDCLLYHDADLPPPLAVDKGESNCLDVSNDGRLRSCTLGASKSLHAQGIRTAPLGVSMFDVDESSNHVVRSELTFASEAASSFENVAKRALIFLVYCP